MPPYWLMSDGSSDRCEPDSRVPRIAVGLSTERPWEQGAHMAGGPTVLSEAVVVFLKKFPGDNGAEFASLYRTAGAGDLVESMMHERNPELSREALTAVGNY